MCWQVSKRLSSPNDTSYFLAMYYSGFYHLTTLLIFQLCISLKLYSFRTVGNRLCDRRGTDPTNYSPEQVSMSSPYWWASRRIVSCVYSLIIQSPLIIHFLKYLHKNLWKILILYMIHTNVLNHSMAVSPITNHYNNIYVLMVQYPM